MEDFETLLRRYQNPVERFVRYRIPSQPDAEDVLQEVYLTAYRGFSRLQNRESFQAWIIAIARNKCRDYFRRRAKLLEIPLDSLEETRLSYSRAGIVETNSVLETMELLPDKEKQILFLFFFRGLPQEEIARRLKIPLGTVKSRLYRAKRIFREKYPCPPIAEIGKGGKNMTKLPERIPDYTIIKSEQEPFSVKWEELMGWMIVPRLGEKLAWGLYDGRSGKRTEYTTMEVVGKAEVHGIEGVELVAVQHDAENYYRTGSVNEMERRFVAQLTDTHCRYLAESHVCDGVRKCYTFLDGDSFLENWGFGENNCGNQVNLQPQHILKREGDVITGGQGKRDLLDIVGRYAVTIGGKQYDTICVMEINAFNDAVASESYLDQNGRTVLWRRFNRDDWAKDRFQKNWSQLLPENQRLVINGQTYVHWYDCISDYIL